MKSAPCICQYQWIFDMHSKLVGQDRIVNSLNNTKWLEGVRLDSLGESEQVLASCTIAREKIEIGDYDAGCAVLAPWWNLGEWPNQKGLNRVAAAELLLTTGSLSNSVARVKRIVGGQRLAEALISGAIALFDHISEN